MRQDILNRLDASRKTILELSDNELESIAGGVRKGPNNKGDEYAGIITQSVTGSDLNPGYEIRPKGAGDLAPARPQRFLESMNYSSLG